MISSINPPAITSDTGEGDQQCMGGRVLPIDHSPLGALSLPVGFHHYSIQRPQQAPIEKYINLLFIYSWHLRYPLISYGQMLTSLTRAIRGSTRRALWDDRLTRRAWVMTLVSQGGPDLTTNRTWWITLLYPQHCTYTHIVVDPATSCTEELQSNSKAGILPPCLNKLSTRLKKVLCFGATYLLINFVSAMAKHCILCSAYHNLLGCGVAHRAAIVLDGISIKAYWCSDSILH